jgi:hypothetical protein
MPWRHRIELKDLDDLLGAEQEVIEGCQHLKADLDAAATFDGREVVIDFDRSSQQATA